MTKLPRTKHNDRNAAGKYKSTPLCDACNKPVGTNYYTDEQACGNSDGPGFYLCERALCKMIRDGLDVEGRRELYTMRRAAR